MGAPDYVTEKQLNELNITIKAVETNEENS